MIPPLDQVKPQLQQQIQQQNLQKLFDDLKAKAKIEIAQATAPSVSPTDKSKPAETNK
jgi:hypothetical protein